MESVLQKIAENNLTLQRSKVKNVLVVVMLEKYPIGDSILFFSKLRAINKYFSNQYFDVLTNQQHYIFLANSPQIRNYYFNMELADFTGYDLVITLSNNDTPLAAFINQKYGPNVLDGTFPLRIKSIYKKRKFEQPLLFDYYQEFEDYILGDYMHERDFSGHELHLSEQEQQWANDWLNAQGIQDHEKVIVVLDNTSLRIKLMPTDAYFDMIRFFMSFPNTRILVFNPDNSNKQDYYQYMLETDNLDKFIFVPQQELRKDICLLGSDYIHMVFGPCTGLLHCAEAIYNYQDANGTLNRKWPLLFTYIGPPPMDDHPDKWFWWGDTHVEALYIEEDLQEPEGRIIRKLTGPGRPGLPCSGFLAAPLIKYLVNHYGNNFREWGIPLSELSLH